MGGRNTGTIKKKNDRRSRHYKRTKGKILRPAQKGFEERLNNIQRLDSEELSKVDLKELPALIEEGRAPENVQFQYKLLTLCLQIILLQMSGAVRDKRNPKLEQVYTLRRLIYGDGDTLLVAATGWGKSVIFHAYSVLTGKMTLQIIPLKKLGGEQMADISKLGYTKPCLLTSESRKEQRTIIEEIKRGDYTHVLLGPEQASSKDFREALKDATFQSKIGLVAIDECHLVDQWKDFRAQFTMLGELRTILQRRVVWFGCSATVEEGVENIVLKSAGFRAVGKHRYQTEVVRTSINRNDIRLSVLPIPRGGLSNYSTLCFLLDKATSVDADGQIQIHPEEIPKTVIFLDNKEQCEVLAQFLRKFIVLKTAKNMSCCQYGTETQYRPYNVFEIVQTFHADVQRWDQDVRYQEFLRSDSMIRVMVATTSLGMGINIPDIKIVVNWKFPIGDSVSEAWQRAGRGGRAKDVVSEAYFFFPYWAFDSEGRDDPSKLLPAPVVPAPPPKRSTKRGKHTLPSLPRDRKPKPSTSSKLQSSINASDLSDNESAACMSQGEEEEEEEGRGAEGQSSSGESVPATQSASAIPVSKDTQTALATPVPEDTRPFWSEKDQTRRATLAPCWKELCNAPCKRKPILQRLGEGRLLAETQRVECLPTECCNGCNPALAPTLTQPPEISQAISPPKSGTKAGYAHALLNEWAIKHAEATYNHPYRRLPVPSTVILPRELGWRLARLYTGGAGVKKPSFWVNLDLEALLAEVPAVRHWRHLERLGADLVQTMKALPEEVKHKMDEKRQVTAPDSQETLSINTESSQSDEPSQRGGSLFLNVASEDALRKKAMIENQIRTQALRTLPSSSQTADSSFPLSPPVVQTPQHTSNGPGTHSHAHALARDFFAKTTNFLQNSTERTRQIQEEVRARTRHVGHLLSSPCRRVDTVDSQKLIPETQALNTVVEALPSNAVIAETQLVDSTELEPDSQAIAPETQLKDPRSEEPGSQSVVPEARLQDVILHSNLGYMTPPQLKRPVCPRSNTPSKRKKMRAPLGDRDPNASLSGHQDPVPGSEKRRRSARITAAKENTNGIVL
jgi:superfamily II DNA/RNA helicase